MIVSPAPPPAPSASPDTFIRSVWGSVVVTVTCACTIEVLDTAYETEKAYSGIDDVDEFAKG